MTRRFLREGKAVLELAVTKCLTGAKLSPEETNEVCALGESDLMRDYGCDLYMAETVKLHAKREMMRLRAQNMYTPIEGLWNKTGYPDKPFTRTEYIKESRRRLAEDIHGDDHADHDHSHSSSGGRMLDYGHTKSDSDEGRMMKQTLRDIAVDAYRLHQMLEDGDDLPQWCQYKTAQAQQMVGSVRNYLEYKLERGGEDPVGEEEMFDPEEMQDDFGAKSTEMAMDSWDDDSDDDHEVEDYDSEGIDLDDPHDASAWAAGYKAGSYEDSDDMGAEDSDDMSAEEYDTEVPDDDYSDEEPIDDDDIDSDDDDYDDDFDDDDDADYDEDSDDSTEGYDDAEVLVSSRKL